MDCLFCSIIDKTIPADIVYQDEQVLAFRDINPQAPTHILVIPQKHIATINDIEKDDLSLLGHMVATARQLAGREGFDEQGYRLVMNCNEQGGQTVFHIHLHLLGGRQLHWPPG